MSRRRPRSRCLAALLASCLATATTAAQATSAAEITESGRSLERALHIAFADKGAFAGSGEDGPRSIVLLVDPTPSLAASGFASKLQRAFAEHAKLLGGAEIALVRVGQGAKKLRFVPAARRAELVADLSKMLRASRNEVRNVFVDLRSVASSLDKRAGQREVLLVTLENGDAEAELEACVKRLASARVRVSAIVREAFLADSYWAKRKRYWRDLKRVRLPRGTELVGGDNPFIDLPWGWVFQRSISNEIVPSGFGAYSINRVVAATGGRVFLYAPPETVKHRCSVYGSCLFCNGDHVPQGEDYMAARLAKVAPSVASRSEAFRKAAKDPILRAVFDAWRKAAAAGVVQTTPLLRFGTTSASRDRDRGGSHLGFWDSLSFARHAKRADKAISDCDKILRELSARCVRTGLDQDGSARSRAMAELTRVQLQLAKVNLVVFAAWCRDIAPGLVGRKRVEVEAPEAPWIDPEQRAMRITYYDFCLCHGVAPFFRVRLPGGARMRGELRELDRLVREFMRKYAHTPYAVAVHRAGIARFSLYGTRGGRRIRPSSTAAKGPTTKTDRGRPVRTGATTGGAARGSSTGGK